MKEKQPKLIKRSEINHRVRRPNQTGFSSPATHYSEPRIDLNDVLVSNPSATFYIRVVDNSFEAHGIMKHDVLIVDRAKEPQIGNLVFAIQEDEFNIVRVENRILVELKIWGLITYIIKSVS